jgi:hypothetical protein
MASIRLRKGNTIIFQLLRKNLAGINEPARIWNEIKVVTLAVQPSFIDYNYRGRSQINQTQERSGFVDKYGMLFTQINMGGSFGVKPRRVGLSLKDGYTRLIEFRDEIVKKSNRVNDELDLQEMNTFAPTNFYGQKLQTDINARYVYAINFYDFINDEMFAIDISTFNIRLDASYNTVLPTYKLGFQEIGDIIKVERKDGVLRAQLAIASVIDSVQNNLDIAVNTISSNAIFQTAELGISFLEDMNFQIDNLKAVLSSYNAALSGTSIQSFAGSSSIGKISFSSVKG